MMTFSLALRCSASYIGSSGLRTISIPVPPLYGGEMERRTCNNESHSQIDNHHSGHCPHIARAVLALKYYYQDVISTTPTDFT